MPPPVIGQVVEDFTLPNQDGEPVSLSSFAGQAVLLFVYPRADTPGCTVEACGFRDAFAQLQASGVAVVGLSRDTVRAQKKFAVKYDLHYPLLADADQALLKDWNLVREKTMYGKPVTGVARTTFLIGPDRQLLRVYENVKPEDHAAQVMADLREAAASCTSA